MYGFVDPNERGYNRDISTEALVWNGFTLDNEIKGFRTLNVEGRESISYEINKLQRPQNGDIETTQSLAGKVITVNFLLEADNARDFNQNWYQLKGIVQGQKKKFRFSDELNEYRIGTVQSITNENAGSYTTYGKIEIYQSDPFVYGQWKSKTVTADENNPIVFRDLDIVQSIRPDNLSVVFNRALGAPTIEFLDKYGRTYTIQLTIPVEAGDRFSINMETGLPYLNGYYKANSLSISSDIGNFLLTDEMIVDNSKFDLREIRYNYNTIRI